MLLNFYVQAGSSSSSSSDASYFDSVIAWAKESAEGLPDVTLEEAIDWTKDRGRRTVDSAKELFRYLTGDPMPVERSTTLPGSMATQTRVKEANKGDNKGVWGSITGLFGSLRNSSRGGADEARSDVASSRLWQEGEVHAELIRVS